MTEQHDIRDLKSIDNWFIYHAPMGNQTERYTLLRAEAGKLARLIVALVPAGADRTAALRKLRETVFTANAAIACDEQLLSETVRPIPSNEPEPPQAEL